MVGSYGDNRMTNKLSAKDQQFADLYFGGPDDMRGNATACYRQIHPMAKDNTCQVEGSKALSKPMVAKYLESKREELTEATGINAEYVLRQSIRYLEYAFGDRPAPKTFNPTAVIRCAGVGWQTCQSKSVPGYC